MYSDPIQPVSLIPEQNNFKSTPKFFCPFVFADFKLWDQIIFDLYFCFKVLPVDPLNPPSSEKLMSLSVIPHDFYCRIELRNPSM